MSASSRALNADGKEIRQSSIRLADSGHVTTSLDLFALKTNAKINEKQRNKILCHFSRLTHVTPFFYKQYLFTV